MVQSHRKARGRAEVLLTAASGCTQSSRRRRTRLPRTDLRPAGGHGDQRVVTEPRVSLIGGKPEKVWEGFW